MGHLSLSAEDTRQGSAILLAGAQAENADVWDDFVDRHPEGRFCHLWAYKRVLEQTYGYECVYSDILWDGQRVGVFPSIRVRARLVSQPFNEYGGPLTDGLSNSQQKSLASLILRVARESGCAAVEIRGGIGCEAMAESEFCIRRPLHAYAVLYLTEADQLWRKSLTYEARKGVNRARKAGLSAAIRQGGLAIHDPFYALYAKSMKRLGVPPHSVLFFKKMAEHLGERLVAAWVFDNGVPVAVLLGVVTGARLHVFAIASDAQSWSMRPNDLAHWELISWASSSGLQVFDFGSARYSGQIQFKKKWGATLHEYCCYFLSSPGTDRRAPMVDTSSPFMVAMSSVWRSTVPEALARVVGPPIRRYLTK